MKRILTLVWVFAVFFGTLHASPPLTSRTVVAKVDSYEYYTAARSDYSYATPYGNRQTIIATIVYPELLAGREIAIPFESDDATRELLVQRGTIFRFEHWTNLHELSRRTDWVHRRVIEFPPFGLLVLDRNGEVFSSYNGALTRLKAAQSKKAPGAVPGK